MASNKQDGGELTRVNSYKYPSGHVNHLTSDQSKSLEQFKVLCKEKGYWVAPSGQQAASHDDETLLRYLRARKFVPAEAFKQFKDTEDWRAENQLDKLYETIDIEEYEQSRKLYPQWMGVRDTRGIPVYLFEVSHLNNKAIAAYENDSNSTLKAFKSKVPIKMLRLFALYENLTRFVLPLCSALPDRQHTDTPISQSSNIVDISGVSLMQFWKLKSHMQDASLLATAHYPETLDTIFLIGAPSFFPTVWGWIKRWFDPITVSKIHVLNQKETLPTLLKYLDIEKIPKKYGGKLDFKFGDLPPIEESIAKQLNWSTPLAQGQTRTIPKGPAKWQHGANGDLEAVAIGTEKGVQRKQVIAGMTHDANVAQMSLSPGRVVSSQGTAQTAQNNPVVAASVTNASQSATTASQQTTTASNAASDTSKSPTQQMSPSTPDPQTSITSAEPLPFRDNMTQAADKEAPLRDGTSATRYEQQSHTLAHGNVVDGTPAIARDGQGEKQSIMEPGTVGQAPKEHPIPDHHEQPTIIDQAKQTAEQALATATHAGQSALAAVGLAGKTEPEKPAVTESKHDPEIDGMEGKKVEEFLRAKTMTKPQA